MAKQSTIVDKEILQACITELEKNGPLKNQSVLWKAAAELYNTKSVPTPITFSVVSLRAGQFGLTFITPLGKKGRGPMTDDQKASMAAGRVKKVGRKTKKEKFAQVYGFDEYMASLHEKAGQKFNNLVVSIEHGSRSAAVKLTCLECVGFQGTADVRNCTANGKNGSNSCPLWLFRPYQGSIEPEEAPDGVAEAADDVVDESGEE